MTMSTGERSALGMEHWRPRARTGRGLGQSSAGSIHDGWAEFAEGSVHTGEGGGEGRPRGHRCRQKDDPTIVTPKIIHSLFFLVVMK